MRRGPLNIVGHLGAIAMACVLGGVSQNADADPRLPASIDVFTTSEIPIVRSDFITATPRQHVTTLKVYEVDGLESLERLLSDGLPSNPNEAQAIVLERMQRDRITVRSLAHAGAEALELALRYGIDRYPAFVFNKGESVIYGVTSVEEAIFIYLRERER